MAGIDRRRLLKLSGAGAVAAGTGGLAGILASGRAPAFAQGTTVHWLRWSDFVPASDQLLKTKIVPEGEKALGVKLNFEMVNANDIQARVTSSVQSGSGPDIILALNNWPQLYTESLADVTDTAEKSARTQGGFYDISKTVGDRRQQMDRGTVVHRRRAGRLSQILVSGDRLWINSRRPGTRCMPRPKTLKAKGRPLGQTLGHTFGDAPGFWYPFCGHGAARRSRPTARPSH